MGKFIEKTFNDGTGVRTYKVHVPRASRRRLMPLIVMLHGCTQDPDDFAAGTQMNALSDEHSCVIVYPAQSTAANPAKCWNWFSAADQQRDQGEPGLIAGITTEVMQAYRIDKQRVFVAGLSAGASMAVIMAATYPELYAAVGAHSGLSYRSAQNMLSAFAAMRNGAAVPRSLPVIGIPIIVFHGDHDQTVNPCNSEQIITQWRASRQGSAAWSASQEETGESNGRSYVRTQYRDIEGSPCAEHWVIRDLGHAWSGGSLKGSYTDPKGPDASQEMLRFFLRRAGHERTGILDRLVRRFKSR